MINLVAQMSAEFFGRSVPSDSPRGELSPESKALLKEFGLLKEEENGSATQKSTDTE